MAITNFLQWDAAVANMESDTQYSQDTQRSNGFVSGPSIWPSLLANKTLYQLTTFAAAYCQALVAKGYSTSDADLATLAAVLANVLTQADMTPTEITGALGFTPVQQGGGAGQGTNKVFLGWSSNGLKLQIDSIDEGLLALQSWVNAGFNPLLGFFPVQQGGGSGQLGNKVRLGWDGNRLKLQVDATDEGRIAMASDLGSTLRSEAGYFIFGTPRTAAAGGGTIELAFGSGTFASGSFIPLPAGFSYSEMQANAGVSFIGSNSIQTSNSIALLTVTISAAQVTVLTEGTGGVPWPIGGTPTQNVARSATLWRIF